MRCLEFIIGIKKIKVINFNFSQNNSLKEFVILLIDYPLHSLYNEVCRKSSIQLGTAIYPS